VSGVATGPARPSGEWDKSAAQVAALLAVSQLAIAEAADLAAMRDRLSGEMGPPVLATFGEIEAEAARRVHHLTRNLFRDWDA
jgi:hypothetical protein